MASGAMIPEPSTPKTRRKRVLELYRRHGRELFGYAYGMLDRPADAEDAIQDAFLRLDRHLAGGGAETNLRAWLYRVVTNLCRDQLRLRGRHSELSAEEPSAPAPVLRRLALSRVFARLRPRDRELVVLRGQGLSYKELADSLELKPASVGKLLARALERFSDAYERELGRKEN